MELTGKVALVAGGTRGAGRGIATELGAAGATVYVSGRTTRGQKSEYNRPETIEETAEIVNALGGRGIAVRVDHLVSAEVRDLLARIRAEQGKLDILVNDIWGGENLKEWNKPVWEHDLENGLRILRLQIETHLITAHHALPLMIEQPGALLVEVIVSKRLGSSYRSGRTDRWRKIKCWTESRFVIVGTEIDSRSGAPVALLAREEENGLRYAGGAFFALRGPQREALSDRLERLTATKPAIAALRRRGARWVKPELVVGVKHLRGSGGLRHATVRSIEE